MITAYRIFKSKHSASWQDGEGAFRYGGRWNSQGTRVLYLSSSLALATLEMLVNLNAEEILQTYSFASAEFESEAVFKVEDFRRLPKGWSDSPPPIEIQSIGDAWAASGSSLALEVPSAILPIERNFLLNVSHPDFSTVRFGKALAITLDKRLR